MMVPSSTYTERRLRNVLDNRFDLARNEGKSKVVSLDKAIRENIADGMSIHILGLHYRAHAALYELFRQFRDCRPNFTIIAGTLHGPIMALFHAGMIKKAVCAFMGEAYPTMGPNPVYNRIFKEGGIEFENWSFLTFTLRLLAGAMGVGFLPTRSLVGSDMFRANDKYCRTVDDPFGKVSDLAAVQALNPDITIIHGQAADEYGNTILLPPRGEDIYGALGSHRGAIVTAEKIVSTDYIRQNSHLVRLPGLFVKSVSEVPMGAHPSGLNNRGLPEVDGYCEDIPFYMEARNAAKDPHTFTSWIKEWILDCEDHRSYLTKLGSERISLLKGRANQDAWLYEINNRISEIEKRPSSVSPLERAVLAAADIVKNRVREGDCKLILGGAGLASLSAWVAIYGLREQEIEAELVSELGFWGFSPRPGEPFLFNLSNIPTCKELDGIFTILGMMMPNRQIGCLGTLSAAQVDKYGNLNSTVIPDKKILITGSGGANDVMSSAKEIVIIIPHSSPFLTKEIWQHCECSIPTDIF
ncbi:MAG: hypothetical protein JRC86_07360 [Deltaproteobacteria bacterium]|nr:hypothetical protein [Deltaproteobacteria bacterium]